MNLSEILGCYSLHPSKLQFLSNRSISHFSRHFLQLFWRKNWAILRKLGATSFLTQIGPNLTQLTLRAMSNIGQSGRMIRQLCLNSGHSTAQPYKDGEKYYSIMYEIGTSLYIAYTISNFHIKSINFRYDLYPLTVLPTLVETLWF